MLVNPQVLKQPCHLACACPLLQVDDFIQQAKDRTLALQPGCDMKQSLEEQITKTLNGIREKVAQVGEGAWYKVLSALPELQVSLVSVRCGAEATIQVLHGQPGYVALAALADYVGIALLIWIQTDKLTSRLSSCGALTGGMQADVGQ